ncbi:hypothetical protein ACFP81_01875 [Deinococcus lacus]|uniref:Uncharacterized protein n=1 Tax=Deinococcus lacus TaxID=392561 RepID=A0ABW1Y9N0_9DEIO
MRVVPVGGALDGVLWVEVAAITWESPHTPRLSWQALTVLPAGASAAEVAAAQAEALQHPSFFVVCDRCNRRHPLGWMHGPGCCQSCAEHWFGAVY